eukprot:SAG31_NODE_28135_length_415_cov_0.648734_1_plen_72_part_10
MQRLECGTAVEKPTTRCLEMYMIWKASHSTSNENKAAFLNTQHSVIGGRGLTELCQNVDRMPLKQDVTRKGK